MEAPQIPGGLNRMCERERHRCEQHHTSMEMCRQTARDCLSPSLLLERDSWLIYNDRVSTYYPAWVKSPRAQCQHLARAFSPYHNTERGVCWLLTPHRARIPLWDSSFPISSDHHYFLSKFASMSL